MKQLALKVDAINALNQALNNIMPDLIKSIAETPLKLKQDNTLTKRSRDQIKAIIASYEVPQGVRFIIDDSYVCSLYLIASNRYDNVTQDSGVIYHQENVHFGNKTKNETATYEQKPMLKLEEVERAIEREADIKKQIRELEGQARTIRSKYYL